MKFAEEHCFETRTDSHGSVLFGVEPGSFTLGRILLETVEEEAYAWDKLGTVIPYKAELPGGVQIDGLLILGFPFAPRTDDAPYGYASYRFAQFKSPKRRLKKIGKTVPRRGAGKRRREPAEPVLSLPAPVLSARSRQSPENPKVPSGPSAIREAVTSPTMRVRTGLVIGKIPPPDPIL